MAEDVNMMVEYDGFYKFYSKYIHPSSWIVNSPIEETESLCYRDIFVSQSLAYAIKVAQLLRGKPTHTPRSRREIVGFGG